MFDDRPERQAGQEIQRADQQHRADEQQTKVQPETGNVPALDGTIFFCASEPAMAMMGMIIRKRPISMAKPRVVLYQGVLALRPAKALPLLPLAEL